MKCLYHALKLWHQRGGYLWVRRSNWCRWLPHFGWCKEVKGAVHWQPLRPLKGWKVFFHKAFARGKIRKVDNGND